MSVASLRTNADLSAAWRIEELRAPLATRRRGLKAAVVLADVSALTVAAVFSIVVAPPFGRVGHLASAPHLFLLAVNAAAVLVLFARYHLYNGRHVAGRMAEARGVVRGLAGGTVAMAAVAYALQLSIHRSVVIVDFATALLVVSVEREALRQAFGRLRDRGRLGRPVLIVGANAEARGLCQNLDEHAALGYRVVGFTATGQVGDTVEDRPVIAEVHETLAAVRQSGASGVIIATTALDLVTTNRLVRQLMKAGIPVELTSSLQDIAPNRVTIRPLGRHPVAFIEPVRHQGWRAAAKRAFDVMLATGGLVLAMPLLLLLAIAIKLDSKGTVLFRQQRVGKDGEHFMLLKFRSMVANAEALVIDLRDENEADGPLFKLKSDPRVTRVGKIIRALHIDELPQLWNVIRGEMSMVGPRPALASEMRLWDEELHERLQVKPGLTGMWQVSRNRHESFDSYARLDRYYVDNWSLATDLAIIFKTVPSVLMGRGEG